MVYINLSYSLGDNPGGGKILYRGGTGGAQKVAWPFDASTAGFRYRLAGDPSTSAGQTSVATASLGDVRFIKAFLPAMRRKTTGFDTPQLLEAHPCLPMYHAR